MKKFDFFNYLIQMSDTKTQPENKIIKHDTLSSDKPLDSKNKKSNIIINKYSKGLERGTTKLVLCSKCGYIEVEINSSSIGGVCHICTTMSCPYTPPVKIKKQSPVDLKKLLQKRRRREERLKNKEKELISRYNKKKKYKKKHA